MRSLALIALQATPANDVDESVLTVALPNVSVRDGQVPATVLTAPPRLACAPGPGPGVRDGPWPTPVCVPGVPGAGVPGGGAPGTVIVTTPSWTDMPHAAAICAADGVPGLAESATGFADGEVGACPPQAVVTAATAMAAIHWNCFLIRITLLATRWPRSRRWFATAGKSI